MKIILASCAVACLSGAAVAEPPAPAQTPPSAPTGAASDTATLSAAGSPDAATHAALRVGAEIRSVNGGFLGKVERVIPATAADAAQVTLRAGERSWTMPQSEISLVNGVLITNRPGGAQ